MSSEQDTPSADPPQEVTDEARRARILVSFIVSATITACALVIICSSAPSASAKLWTGYIGPIVAVSCLVYGLVDLYLYRRNQRVDPEEQELPQPIQTHVPGEGFIDLMISRNGFVQ